MKFINKKKCLFIFFFVLLFNITYISNSHSQSNIAILDVLTLLKESKAAKSMKDQLDKVAKEYSDVEKKKAKEIQKKEEELLRQKSTLTPEAFSDRKNAFEKTVIEFNKTRDTNRRALAKAERESMVKIESAVEKIVKEIQTAEKIDVVIKKTAVILSEDSIDITSKVIEKLNKEVSTIDVNVAP
ncbi:MAG: hypothetical protein CFH24_00172 [Alphaproteobacteria bacterium MarineAlpha6_Bin2]|nr:MAG: hypothetical protein CFH24_00172 [Alphaproteobacteria bacterium MarineAlpha6_Bin2]